MGEAKVTKEDLLKIKEFIEDIRFGSVTVIVQDGRIIQIEKKEKVRLNHWLEEDNEVRFWHGNKPSECNVYKIWFCQKTWQAGRYLTIRGADMGFQTAPEILEALEESPLAGIETA